MGQSPLHADACPVPDRHHSRGGGPVRMGANGECVGTTRRRRGHHADAAAAPVGRRPAGPSRGAAIGPAGPPVHNDECPPLQPDAGDGSASRRRVARVDGRGGTRAALSRLLPHRKAPDGPPNSLTGRDTCRRRHCLHRSRYLSWNGSLPDRSGARPSPRSVRSEWLDDNEPPCWTMAAGMTIHDRDR